MLLWDAVTCEHLRILTGHTNGVGGGAESSPDGRLLAGGGWDKTVQLWDLTSLSELRPGAREYLDKFTDLAGHYAG